MCLLAHKKSSTASGTCKYGMYEAPCALGEYVFRSAQKIPYSYQG